MLVSAEASARTWSPQNRCLPFFDFLKDKVVSNVVQQGSLQQGEVDITPEPAQSTSFGDAALRACGAFGSRINPQAVKRLVEDFNPDLFKELAREFSNYTDSQLRVLLAHIWTVNNGFEHVFCGQPKSDKIGGLHYWGRYFELQEKGQICRLPGNIVNEEVLPQAVYTIGVETADGLVDRKKGFSIRQSAEDIFFEASRAFLRNCHPPAVAVDAKDRKVCVTRFYKDGSFGSRFVCGRNQGIITFYPLAFVPRGTPICK